MPIAGGAIKSLLYSYVRFRYGSYRSYKGKNIFMRCICDRRKSTKLPVDCVLLYKQIGDMNKTSQWNGKRILDLYLFKMHAI